MVHRPVNAGSVADFSEVYNPLCQGYRTWISSGSAFPSRTAAEPGTFSRKPSSHPALFGLPRTDVTFPQPAVRARSDASLRIVARLSGPLSFRSRRPSSPMVTSRTRCGEFPAARCGGAVDRNRSGPSLPTGREQRVSVFRPPLVPRVAVSFPTVGGPGRLCRSRRPSTSWRTVASRIPVRPWPLSTSSESRVLSAFSGSPDGCARRRGASPGCPRGQEVVASGLRDPPRRVPPPMHRVGGHGAAPDAGKPGSFGIAVVPSGLPSTLT